MTHPSDDRLEALAAEAERRANALSSMQADGTRVDRDPFFAEVADTLHACKGRGVGVEPLEWVKLSCHSASASTIFGDYAIGLSLLDNPPGKYRLNMPGGLREYHPTLDEAKAAAQADYKRRILSALTYTPDTDTQAAYDRGWNAAIEAAAAYHDNFLVTKTSINVEKIVASTEAILALKKDHPHD